MALAVDADGQHPAASARAVLEASDDPHALVLGAHFPDLVHGVVALVPSSTVHPGLDASGAGVGPAWTVSGEALPAADEPAGIYSILSVTRGL